MRIQNVRTDVRWLRARLLLAARTPDAPRVARRAARVLAREGPAYARVWAHLLRAAVEDGGERRTQLERAAVEAEAEGLHGTAAVARRLLADPAADDWLRAHGIADPARFTSVLLPLP